MKVATVVAALALALSSRSAWAQDQQLGARAKAMGGSYTAFEDDPVSIWLNPAGIATQTDSLAVAYQTYTAYPVGQSRGPGDTINFSVKASSILGDPALLPSFIGFVFQLGDSLAVGVCYARPYLLDYAMDQVRDPNQTQFTPSSEVQEDLSRFRASIAKDFRLKDPGEAGFLTHLSAGLGLDLGYERWHFTGLGQDTTNSTSAPGFGAGLLLGLYDNTNDFKVNFGAAYTSPIHYNFRINPDVLPAFDMPQQVNAGFTFYLLEKTPLRATIDGQWIQWAETAQKPLFDTFKSFRDAYNVSFGVEYRIPLTDRVSVYPRAGYRRFEAPWSDQNNLPMTGPFKLVLASKASTYNIGTYGLGLTWTSDAGKVRSLDLGGDAGGDSQNFAISVTFEF